MSWTKPTEFLVKFQSDEKNVFIHIIVLHAYSKHIGPSYVQSRKKILHHDELDLSAYIGATWMTGKTVLSHS